MLNRGGIPMPEAEITAQQTQIHLRLSWSMAHIVQISVADLDPPDPHVFGPPGSGSTSQRYGSGSGSGTFYHHAKIVRKTLIPSILGLILIFIFEK